MVLISPTFQVLIIQKVGPKAKYPQKKNKKIPTHPMTMPQAAGKKIQFSIPFLLDRD